MGAAPKAIGVDMVHVATLLTDVMGSRAPTYGAPRHIPELTKLGVKIQSEATKFPSDNRLSEVIPKISGAQIAMSVGGLSLESYNAVEGWGERETNNPARLDDLQKLPGYVALGYRRKMHGTTSDGRQRFRYVWLFKVLFLPPDDETDTEPEKGVTVQPDQLAGEALALDAFAPTNDYWRYVYDNWADGASQALDESFFDVVTGVTNIPTITISAQPESVAVTAGSISGALGVTASASSGVLTYQWMKAGAATNEGGVAVEGANAASLAIPTDLTAGLHYFYCRLGISGKDVVLRSNVAVVLVE